MVVFTTIIPLGVFIISIFNLFFSVKMNNATHKLNVESKNIININNNIINHEFYKRLYDELLDIYRLYEDVAEETANDVEPDYNQFGSWEEFKEYAIHSKGIYEGIGIDYITFEKVEKKLDSIRYCLPDELLKQLEITKVAGKKEGFSYMQTREEIPDMHLTEEHYPWIEGYRYDKDKKLFVEIEKLLQSLSAKKYY